MKIDAKDFNPNDALTKAKAQGQGAAEVSGYMAAEALVLIKQLAEAVEALQADAERLRGKGIAFQGKWHRNSSYEVGDMVIHAGSAWIASEPNSQAPGACQSWQRLLKSDRIAAGGTDDD